MLFTYQVNEKRVSISGKIKVFKVLTIPNKGALYEYCKHLWEIFINKWRYWRNWIGFSAGALLLGEKVYVSPNDNSDHQIKIKNGLGLFSQFLISVHYDSWNDKANKDRAEELVNVPIIPLNDHSCLVLDKLGNIIEKID